MKRYVTKTAISGTELKFRKWVHWEIGDIVVGKYVSKGLDKYKKNSYRLEVVDAFFKDGSSDDYQGKVLALNANGLLDYAMEEIELGELVQIEYLGTKELEKGPYAGKESHQLKIDIVQIEEEEGSEDDL